jgi:hypothetical protein
MIAIAVLAVLGLAECATYPAQVTREPPRFENDAVRLEWAIGINFFRMKITNLTTEQIDLDLTGSAVISVDGEARPLAAMTGREAAMIPPKSYIILGSPQGAVFGTDIFGRFNAETEDKYPLPADPSSDDRLFLKSHSGDTLRLYLSATVRGRKTVLDIPFKITGAARVQSAAGDTSPAQAAPQASPKP